MKLLYIFSLIFLLTTTIEAKARCGPSVTRASGEHLLTKEICRGDLIFEDNFDFLDFTKWQHESTLGGGGNWEFQWYGNNRTNSFTKDGALNIRPSLVADQFGEAFLSSGVLNIQGGSPADECTNPQWWGCERSGNPDGILNPIKSARLRTVKSFSFKYGRVEISAKLPAGDWLWPAFWMLPTYNAYGSWPASGEVDIMESRGNKNLVKDGVNIGTQQIGTTLNYGPDGNYDAWDTAHFDTNYAPGYDTDFHRFQMEWNPDGMIFSIDDVETGRFTPPDGGFWELGNFANNAPGLENPWRFASKMAPFDQEFYLLINLAAGGIAYFPDNAQNPDPKPWSNTSPTAAKDFYAGRDAWLRTWNLQENDGDQATFKIDYVRVWAL